MTTEEIKIELEKCKNSPYYFANTSIPTSGFISL